MVTMTMRTGRGDAQGLAGAQAVASVAEVAGVAAIPWLAEKSAQDSDNVQMVPRKKEGMG